MDEIRTSAIACQSSSTRAGKVAEIDESDRVAQLAQQQEEQENRVTSLLLKKLMLGAFWRMLYT